MRGEINSKKKNQVWDLVDLLSRHKPIGNICVLKIKCKTNGSIDKYKVHFLKEGIPQRGCRL